MEYVPCKHPSCNLPRIALGYCSMHYKRAKSGADMDAPRKAHKDYVPRECQVGGCGRAARGHGYCSKHLYRYKKGLDLNAGRALDHPETCTVEGCDRPYWARGYCTTHRNRFLKGQDLLVPVRPSKHKDGTVLLTTDGYARVRVTGADGRPRWVREHRWVMQAFLGRPLHRHEDVHHKNGVRTDNRLENLELWSKSHPKGQRVEDKIQFWGDFVKQYLPADDHATIDVLSAEAQQLVAL